MRIDLSQTAANQISSEAKSSQISVNRDADVSLAHSEDKTTLTSAPDSVRSLVSTAMASPEIRQDKIETLKQAISSGKYELDPVKIATAMIDEHA